MCRDMGDPRFEVQRVQISHDIGHKWRGDKNARVLKVPRKPPHAVAVEELIREAVSFGHQIVALIAPPSMTMFCPTIKPACCEHKNAQVAPNSAAVP